MPASERKARTVTTGQLRDIIEATAGRNPGNGCFEIYDFLAAAPAVASDLSRIRFDLENFADSCRNYGGTRDGHLLGYQTCGDLAFLGCYAGGDWEYPLYFIIYLDDAGVLRAFIPEAGNHYNTRLGKALGNSRTLYEAGNDPANTDVRVLQEVYGYVFRPGEHDPDDPEDPFDYDPGELRLDFDWRVIAAEIGRHIHVGGANRAEQREEWQRAVAAGDTDLGLDDWAARRRSA